MTTQTARIGSGQGLLRHAPIVILAATLVPGTGSTLGQGETTHRITQHRIHNVEPICVGTDSTVSYSEVKFIGGAKSHSTDIESAIQEIVGFNSVLGSKQVALGVGFKALSTDDLWDHFI